jgi:hypothetical protein
MARADDPYHQGIENFQKIYILLETLQIDLSEEPFPRDRVALKKKVDELCYLADLHAEFLQKIRKNKFQN